MEVKQKGMLTKMSRGRSKKTGNWKERYFELALSKAAHSYSLQYSKGPGKKTLGEIRIDKTSKVSTSSRIHSGFQCLVLTNETDELHFHAKTQKEQTNWENSLNKAIADVCKSAQQRVSLNRHLKQKDQMLGSMDALREAHRRQQQYIHVLEQENNDLNEMLQQKKREAAGVGGIVSSGGLKEQLAQKISENAKLEAEVKQLKRQVQRLTAAVEASKQKSGNQPTAKLKAAPAAAPAPAPAAAPVVVKHESSMTVSYTVKKSNQISSSGFDDSDDDDSDDDDSPPPPPPSP